MDELTALEQNSIYSLREAYAKIERLGMLWSKGKDSTVLLGLTRKAFFGHDRLAREWSFRLIVAQNREAAPLSLLRQRERHVLRRII